MSKKDLVKRVIDDMVKNGADFYELTQGSLSKIKELSGVSKTTIKRAKNEYKKEKIVVQQNYKETLIKRRIYKYLDKNPRSSLGELRDSMPDISPSKVSEYHLFWNKKKNRSLSAETHRPATVSPRKLKEMIFSFLNQHNDATADDLFNAFPTANRSSVTSYLGHWKKKQTLQDVAKEGSLSHILYKYLDNHPGTTVDDLRKNFPSVHSKSIEVYHSLWTKQKNDNKRDGKKNIRHRKATRGRPVTQTHYQSSDKAGKRRGGGMTSKEALSPNSSRGTVIRGNQSIPKTATTVDHKTRIIESLKETIESQRITITALEVEHSMLLENKPRFLPDLEGMSKEELKEIQLFIRTYLKGLKKKRGSSSH